MAKPINNCPKADRCRRAPECICSDTFRGEYLCFERGRYSEFEKKQKLYEGKKRAAKRAARR